MGLFGGDPRLVHLEILFKMNVWYDIVMIPTLFIAQMKRFASSDALLIAMIFMVFEVIRISLHKSHWKGDIPVYVAFILLTIIPTVVLAVLWLLILPGRTAFDMMVMIGYVIMLLVELFHCVAVYKRLKFYQDGFFQFARGTAITAHGPIELEEM
jgi:hypothetical protein